MHTIPETVTTMITLPRVPNVSVIIDDIVRSDLACRPNVHAGLVGNHRRLVNILLRQDDSTKLDRLKRWLPLFTGRVHMQVTANRTNEDLVCLDVHAIDHGGSLIVTIQFSKHSEPAYVACIRKARHKTPDMQVRQLLDLRSTT